jgi:hypothetical protein
LCQTSECRRSTYGHAVANASLRSGASTQQKRACSLEQYRVGGSADHVVVEQAGLAHEFVLAVGRNVRGRPDARGRGEVRRQFLDREDALDLLMNNGIFSLQ